MRVISGNLKGRVIKGYTIDGTRPTMDRVKESIFSTIQSDVANSIFLDLFAGSGSMGIEAISNGANTCYFVDKSRSAINVLNENINTFNIKYKSIIVKNDYNDALNYFKKNNIKFDIIFVDPPYNMHIINDIIENIDNNNLLNDNGIIICEVDNKYLNDEFNTIFKYKDKKYGSTYVYFYRKR